MKIACTFLLAALALGGCAPRTGIVTANDAWCRATPPGAPAAGCFVTLTASAADRLIGVESDAGASAEIHTMTMVDGVMRMRRLEQGVVLTSGRPAALKPGADHLMIMGPKTPLVVGGTVGLKLLFEKAPPVTITAPVRAMAAPMQGVVH